MTETKKYQAICIKKYQNDPCPIKTKLLEIVEIQVHLQNMGYIKVVKEIYSWWFSIKEEDSDNIYMPYFYKYFKIL